MTDTTTLPRSVVEQALEALDALTDRVDGTGFANTDEFDRALDSISALRAALEQLQVEQEPVAEVTVSHVLPDLEGRCTAEIASCERLPVGAEFFIHPQNLRCKSNQARLATLWGYVKPQPQVEQEPRYLAGGARYKVMHLTDAGYCIHGLPKDLLGQWVAFVDATDNKHMSHPQPKREPLTQAQVVDGFCSTPHAVQCVGAFSDGVRYSERAHGIGGDA